MTFLRTQLSVSVFLTFLILNLSVDPQSLDSIMFKCLINSKNLVTTMFATFVSLC